MQIIKSFIREEEGAELAEYALLVVILALGILTAVPNLISGLSTAFDNTGNKAESKTTGSAWTGA
jgi:Flp pilus assembly pilin Flp